METTDEMRQTNSFPGCQGSPCILYFGDILDASNWKEIQRKKQNTLEVIPSGLGTPRDPPGGPGGRSEEKDVQATLVSQLLLHPRSR